MIKIENIDVAGWEAAVRGMRNPMNSWDQSDSTFWGCNDDYCPLDGIGIGKNDLNLMKRLAAAGPDHRKFMRMINVTMDITAPLYWWKEYDTYKVGTVADSCSTMHKIHAKLFELDDFSHEHLSGTPETVLLQVIDMLNCQRALVLKWKDKEYWWNLIQLLPSSYNQRRTVQLNYEVLRNIYHARKAHKLDEWRELCALIEILPHSELITMKGGGEHDK
jgi:hypothetical protein